MEILKTLGAIAAILGPFVAAASIGVAIWVYRRNADHEMYSRFRLSLVDLHDNLRILVDKVLVDALFIEVGINIANELRILLPTAVTNRNLIEYLGDINNRPYIRQAIALGYQKSEQTKPVIHLSNAVHRVPIEFKPQFPVLSSRIEALARLITFTASTSTAPFMYQTPLTTQESFDDTLGPRVSNIDDQNTTHLFREVASVLSDGSRNFLRSQLLLLDQTKELIQILSDKYSALTDDELNTHRKTQLKKMSEITRFEKQVASIGNGLTASEHIEKRIFRLLEFLQEEQFSSEERQEISRRLKRIRRAEKITMEDVVYGDLDEIERTILQDKAD